YQRRRRCHATVRGGVPALCRFLSEDRRLPTDDWKSSVSTQAGLRFRCVTPNDQIDLAETMADHLQYRLAHDNTSDAEEQMAKLARDVMTPDPACCSPSTTLDQVAKMMVQNNCGEIPIVDTFSQPSGA